MMMALSKELMNQVNLVLLSGREGLSQTLCVFYHVPRLYRHPWPYMYVYVVVKIMILWSFGC